MIRVRASAWLLLAAAMGLLAALLAAPGVEAAAPESKPWIHTVTRIHRGVQLFWWDGFTAARDTSVTGSDVQYRVSSQYPRSVTILVRDIPAVYTERATAHEEQDGAVVFTVRLSYPPPHAVSVDYTTVQAAVAWQGAAPATAGSDYTHVSGTVKFGKGETAKKVRVPSSTARPERGRSTSCSGSRTRWARI